MKTDLFNNYISYYNNQTIDSLFKLIDKIKAYRFEDYFEFQNKMIEFINNNQIKAINCDFYSSNSGLSYAIGPFSRMLIYLIENILRSSDFPNILKPIQTYLLFEPFDKRKPFLFNEKSLLLDKIKGREDVLLDYLNKLKNPIGLIGLPHVLNELTYVLESCKNITHLVNVDSPGFIRESTIPVNDQMIHWKTGLNFFTCKFKNKHILPIFLSNNGYFYNLLNISQMKQQDKSDYFKIISFEPCQCGRIKANFEFKPHQQNYPGVDYFNFLKIANQLPRIEYIQFIYRKNSIQVCCPEELDIQYLFNQKITFNTKQYLQIGRKLPAIWKTSQLFL